MRVGKFLELAKRFPEDAELHLDGQWPYVEVKGQGYFDLDYPDSKLPWLEQPLTKVEQMIKQAKQ